MEKGILLATILTGIAAIGLAVNETFDWIFAIVIISFIFNLITLLKKK